MFGLSIQAGGQALAVPDVCKTPAPPAPPIPLPYPNQAMTEMSDPMSASTMVFYTGMPALNLKSQWKMSMGDIPGVAGGIISGKNMGEVRFTMGSMKVFLQGAPAVRLTSQTMHNGTCPNAPMGTVIAPNQTVVMIMS